MSEPVPGTMGVFTGDEKVQFQSGEPNRNVEVTARRLRSFQTAGELP